MVATGPDRWTEGRKPGRGVSCSYSASSEHSSHRSPTSLRLRLSLGLFGSLYLSLRTNALSLPARLLCVTCPSILPPPPPPPPPINFIPGETSFGGESQLGLRKGDRDRACLARCSAYSFAIQFSMATLDLALLPIAAAAAACAAFLPSFFLPPSLLVVIHVSVCRMP